MTFEHMISFRKLDRFLPVDDIIRDGLRNYREFLNIGRLAECYIEAIFYEGVSFEIQGMNFMVDSCQVNEAWNVEGRDGTIHLKIAINGVDHLITNITKFEVKTRNDPTLPDIGIFSSKRINQLGPEFVAALNELDGIDGNESNRLKDIWSQNPELRADLKNILEQYLRKKHQIVFYLIPDPEGIGINHLHLFFTVDMLTYQGNDGEESLNIDRGWEIKNNNNETIRVGRIEGIDSVLLDSTPTEDAPEGINRIEQPEE